MVCMSAGILLPWAKREVSSNCKTLCLSIKIATARKLSYYEGAVSLLSVCSRAYTCAAWDTGTILCHLQVYTKVSDNKT